MTTDVLERKCKGVFFFRSRINHESDKITQATCRVDQQLVAMLGRDLVHIAEPSRVDRA